MQRQMLHGYLERNNPLILLKKPKVLGLGNLGLIIGLFHNVCPITCLFYYHPSNGRLSQLYCGDSAHFLISKCNH